MHKGHYQRQHVATFHFIEGGVVVLSKTLFNMIFLLLEYFIYNLYCKYNTLANTELNEKYVVEMLYVIVLSPCR
jgi:hypothetical protein